MQQGPITSASNSAAVVVALNPENGEHQIDVTTAATTGSLAVDIATPGKPDVWQPLKVGGTPVVIAAADFPSLLGLTFFANRIRVTPSNMNAPFTVLVSSRK